MPRVRMSRAASGSHATVGFRIMLAARPSRQRDLGGHGERAHHRSAYQARDHTLWQTSTLAEDLACRMPARMICTRRWIVARAPRSDPKEARSAPSGAVAWALDLSSSYFEGTSCPLQSSAKPRWQDRSTGQLWVLTDARSCPVRCRCTRQCGRQPNLLPELNQLREQFSVEQLVMVGDRGMVSNQAIATMQDTPGVDWITALKSASIRGWSSRGTCSWVCSMSATCSTQLPDYPGERLVACRNPQLASLRAHKREELLVATERNLQSIKARSWRASSRRRCHRTARGGGQSVQGRQALRAQYRRGELRFPAQAPEHRRRGRTGRHLHHPHLGGAGEHGCRRLRA